ncbi:MAG TPA: hypothetical protein VGD69_30955 [Herpetosiphonaceae bacterium]
MTRRLTPRSYLRLAALCSLMLGTLPSCGQPQPDDAAATPAVSAPAIASAQPGAAIAQGCTAPDDGSRAGYHSAQGSTWIIDCENPLRREYWRVFLGRDQRAAIIPRPDGAPELQPACASVDHPLRGLVERYGLCAQAANEAQVIRVNSLLPGDALQITHFLHTQLRFRVTPEALGITPYPIPSDILDACALHPEANSAALNAICERERGRIDGGAAVGFVYTGPGAAQLVERLNELYGIS